MHTYRNISNELKAYFRNNQVFKVLLPLDMLLLFGGIGVVIINQFFNLGWITALGWTTTLGYYTFLLGLLLAYANFNQKYLYAGFFLYGGLHLWIVLSNIYKYRFLNVSALITAGIFLWIGYLIYRNDNKYSNFNVLRGETKD